MPQVDFTFDELKQCLDQHLDEHFIAERSYTREIVRLEVRQEVSNLAEQFSSFVEDNFNPVIESLQEQINEIRRDMKRMRVVVD
jgi:hypothetical protein